MARRALPATDWRQVRKDAAGATEVNKSTVTSDSVAESGKAPPGHIAGREYPGQRVKVPPVDDTADTSEVLTLPRKAEPKKCDCQVEKCNCNTIKDDEEAKTLKERAAAMFGMEVDKDGNLKEQPVLKPLPKPTAGQTQEQFVSACMASLNSEYPDEKQRAAICYSQWTEAKKAEAPPEVQKADDVAPKIYIISKAIEPYKTPAKAGVMLALAVPEHVGKKLHQEGGMHPDDMHVTLGYYGKVGEHIAEDHVEAMRKCVMKAAQGYKPINAAIGGLGRFNATKSSDNKDVLIGLVDSPDLHDTRDHLIQHVQKCSDVAKAGEETKPTGPAPFKNHGYTPHITLGYIDPEDKLSVHKLERQEFTFTHLMMAVGKEKKLYALGEQPNVSKSIWMPIVKADDELRLATGIVLQPEVVDAQGDIISAQVIRQAAHNFLALYNKKTQLGLQHELMKPEGVELVESWITPVDMVLNNRVIKAGTWMMTVRVKNDVLWTRIKTGQLGGFSIGGVARVQKLAV